MLKTTSVADTASANRLVALWTARYLPDLSILPQQKGEFPAAELAETASNEGRAKTVEKVLQLLQINCEKAGMQSHTLLDLPNIIYLSNARSLAQHVRQVYEITLNIYKRQPPPSYYLKFIEEQVCIPWQRLCAVAANHLPGSPTLIMIEHLLEMSPTIAQSVYSQARQSYPHHRSRRGSLSDSGITASTLRDLNMVQGYLWLCVLEGDMSAAEEKLLPLCAAVFPNISVKWDLVEGMLQLLEAEIHLRLTAEQRDRLRPFTQDLRQMFSLPHLRWDAIEYHCYSRTP